MKFKVSQTLHEPFIRPWCKFFGEALPLGYNLRAKFPEIWTRFHALPNSKRYAESTDEKNVVLSRANTLVDQCFSSKNEVWLVIVQYDETDSLTSDTIKHWNLVHLFSWIDETEEPEHAIPMAFFGAKIEWPSSNLNPLFSAVAEDECSVVLFNTSSGTVFAPYDGGFDLISAQKGLIASLETKFIHWMSHRTDKL
jgi:hypothetical protein